MPRYVEVAAVKPLRFARMSDDELLGFGVPPEWLADVRAADENSLLALAGHLPAEAAEALFDVATGSRPKGKPPVAPSADPFEHPDALRRFRVMGNVEELARALDYPWEKWTIFLQPGQRQLVKRDFAGPARGSDAGVGVPGRFGNAAESVGQLAAFSFRLSTTSAKPAAQSILRSNLHAAFAIAAPPAWRWNAARRRPAPHRQGSPRGTDAGNRC